LFSVSPKEEATLANKPHAKLSRERASCTGLSMMGSSGWQRLAQVSDPKWKYSFRVIDSPEVNAFALPGGYVYVFPLAQGCANR
jgi:predicted Zn-dependent protease